MTLKNEYEILRGGVIPDLPSPSDVPCFETSDADRLCRSPLVSVHMMTYNHESYIRQAIEGVMMQQTDFEYELVIGEDCSQDRTREICFEYQKRYPEKIRVLWSEHNVFSIGGNDVRTTANCRGEFIAICEGDDYWTDPRKLQKQVDVMRMRPNVALCFTGADIWDTTTDRHREWSGVHDYDVGLIRGADFARTHLWGHNPNCPGADFSFIVTGTTLFRRAVYEKAVEKFELMSWNLYLGDSQTWLGLAALGDVYYLPDQTAVYRRNEGGLTKTSMRKVGIDATLVRLFFATEVFKRISRRFPTFWLNATAVSLLAWQFGKGKSEIRKTYRQICATRYAFLLRRLWVLPVRLAFCCGIASPILTNNLRRFYNFRPFKLFYR